MPVGVAVVAKTSALAAAYPGPIEGPGSKRAWTTRPNANPNANANANTNASLRPARGLKAKAKAKASRTSAVLVSIDDDVDGKQGKAEKRDIGTLLRQQREELEQ